MRVEDLIHRSALARVSKDEARARKRMRRAKASRRANRHVVGPWLFVGRRAVGRRIAGAVDVLAGRTEDGGFCGRVGAAPWSRRYRCWRAVSRHECREAPLSGMAGFARCFAVGRCSAVGAVFCAVEDVPAWSIDELFNP